MLNSNNNSGHSLTLSAGNSGGLGRLMSALQTVELDNLLVSSLTSMCTISICV